MLSWSLADRRAWVSNHLYPYSSDLRTKSSQISEFTVNYRKACQRSEWISGHFWESRVGKFQVAFAHVRRRLTFRNLLFRSWCCLDNALKESLDITQTLYHGTGILKTVLYSLDVCVLTCSSTR